MSLRAYDTRFDGLLSRFSGLCGSTPAKKIRAESSSNDSECGVLVSLRTKSELSSHQMAVRWSCGQAGSLCTSALCSHRMARLIGRHPQSPTGRAQITSDLLRYWSWYLIQPHLGPRSSSQLFCTRAMVRGRSSVSSRSILSCVSLLGVTIHSLLR